MAMTSRAELSLWEGVWDVQVQHNVSCERYDVTCFGDTHARFINGPVHEDYSMQIRCDRRAYDLLMALLQAGPKFDPVTGEVVVRIRESAQEAATLPKVAEEPVRVIMLE